MLRNTALDKQNGFHLKQNIILSDFLIFQWKNREMWREKYGGPKKHQKSEREKHLLVNLSESANARAISCCFVRFKVDNKLPVSEKKVFKKVIIFINEWSEETLSTEIKKNIKNVTVQSEPKNQRKKWQRRRNLRRTFLKILFLVDHSRNLLLGRGPNPDRPNRLGRDRSLGNLLRDLHHQQQLQGLAGSPRGHVCHAAVHWRNSVSGNHPLSNGWYQVRLINYVFVFKKQVSKYLN